MKRSEQQTALLIDANALLHRAWHALPRMTSPAGVVVNAVYGFSSILLKILQSESPGYVAVCWDTPEPTFRHVAAPEYKAQRVEQPQEFYAQVPLTKQIVTAFGATNVELPGYEADDLLGTIAIRLAKKGVRVTVLTSDRDAFQLIGPLVSVMSFKKGVSETIVYDEPTLLATTGLRPQQIIDYKALRGDASDNLKGVPGIGEKTATDLLLSYQDLAGIFRAAHDAKSTLSSAVRQKLVLGEQAAKDTLPLVQLQLDAPMSQSLEDLRFREADIGLQRQLFLELGFKTLLNRLETRRGAFVIKAVPQTEPVRTGPLISTEHQIISRIEDLKIFVQDVRQEAEVYVYVESQPQTSLFRERPELFLGSKKRTVGISPALFLKPAARAELVDMLADAACLKIGHSLKHVWHWLRAHELEFNGCGFDTELAAYLLSAGEGSHDLAAITAARLHLAIAEDDAAAFQWLDAMRALRVMLEQELIEQNLMHILQRFELPLIPVLGKMEDQGILIDRTYFKHIAEDFRAEKSRLEKRMITLAGEEFNPASPSQLAHILFNKLAISTKGIKRGKTGISTAATELEKLEGLHPIIEHVGEYREVAKLLSTYVEALPPLADSSGRIHTTYNQALAATGRLSSINPNLQNIPIRTELGRKIRRGFIASPGYKLVSCDYSQIELRVIAALAHDKKMLEAFEQGLDIHTATAAAIQHIPLDEVTKDQRRAAKAINFGVIYGQGPHGLAKAAGIPYEEAKQFIDEYFQVYSGIREYLDQTKALAHARGYVETLFGRRRSIPDINSPMPQVRAAAERMAINMPVQGTATGDLVKLALIELDAQLPKISPNTRMLLQVHDEVVFEVPDKEVEKLARAVKNIMENVEKIGCPIVVDAKAGDNWEEMEKIIIMA